MKHIKLFENFSDDLNREHDGSFTKNDQNFDNLFSKDEEENENNVVNSIEDFANIADKMDIRTMIHNDACQNVENGMNDEESWQDACDGFCDRYLGELTFNISNDEISEWLWDHAS